MNNPRNGVRAKLYTAAALLVSAALMAAAVANWQLGHLGIAYIEFALVAFFIISIYVAWQKQYLEVLSHVLDLSIFLRAMKL